MPEFAPLSDAGLMLLYYQFHDEADCPACHPGAPVNSDKNLVADEISRRNYAWLYYYFARYNIYLTELPEVLAIRAIYKALRTECRPHTRYDGARPFRAWLKAIARNLRLDHTKFGTLPDAELIAQLSETKGVAECKRLRQELDRRYREILTEWFRHQSENCGCGGRPEEIKPLVDQTINRVFTAIEQFDREKTTFVLWLSRIATDVLNWHAIRPASQLPDVPQYLPPKHTESSDRILSTRNPHHRMVMTQFTDKVFVEAWQRLNRTEQHVVWMVDVEGRSSKQAACLLRRTVGTVNNNLGRGRKKLREYLQRLGYTPVPDEDPDAGLIASYRDAIEAFRKELGAGHGDSGPAELREYLEHAGHTSAPKDPDADLIARHCGVITALRKEVEGRYRDLLVEWFRKRRLDRDGSSRQMDVKPLVNATFGRVFAGLEDPKHTETEFIVLLGRTARIVLGEL